VALVLPKKKKKGSIFCQLVPLQKIFDNKSLPKLKAGSVLVKHLPLKFGESVGFLFGILN
jgi:hypothetical protein